MLKTSSLVALTFGAILAASAQGYAQTQPDTHHPAQGAGTTETTLADQQQSGMSMPMMTNMMSGRMKMMAGGTQIGMDGMEMSAMGMTERVEGRIAFLRAELKVNDAQAKVWNKFSDLLRNNANVPMMPDTSAPQLLA